MRQELRWSADLGMDLALLWLWIGMWGLAVVAVGWVLWSHLPAVWQWGAILAVGLLPVGWRWRPAAFFAPGFLVLKGQRAHWQGLDAAAEWVWLGERLLGLRLNAGQGRPMTIWITRRRVGTVAWWQLRRSLALYSPGK